MSRSYITKHLHSHVRRLAPSSPATLAVICAGLTGLGVNSPVAVAATLPSPAFLTSAATGTSASATSTTTSASLPIPVYTGVNMSNFPTFNVSSYSASGIGTTVTCTGAAGSNQLTCTGSNGFVPGQGIRIVGGGNAAATAAITTQPLIYRQGQSGAGTHTYCYVVDTLDPLGGISAPSPQACISGEPALSLATTYNILETTTSSVGPSPSFLWYASEDGGPFKVVNIAKFVSAFGDLGQRIGSRGGWPDNLPQGNPNIAKRDDLFTTVRAVNGSQITLANALVSSVQNATVDHDDTQAVQSAILAAVNAGGGTIAFGAGTFNLRRPAFSYVVNNSYAYPTYGTNLALDPYWAGFSYLYIPNGSVGNINFQGAGRNTTLVTPPDHGGVATFLAVGNEQREGAVGTPILAMDEVAKGATQITLTSSAAAASLRPGEDLYLFSGTFLQTPVVDTSSPNMNHFSEINTIASISGNVITLAYPTTKRYFNDGQNSFGVTQLPVTPHNIAMQHLNISTSEPITTTGDVIGMLVNDVHIQGVLSMGAFGGGYKRGVTIENSLWSFGQGGASWGQEDEYDQFNDLAFLNNSVTGYAAPGSEGPSAMARIYATEGTSQVLFWGNTFDHVSIYADQTTDFYVQNNTFTDGIINLGVAYGAYTQPYDPGPAGDHSFLSFDSQGAASTDHNSFTITSDFNPPWVIRNGDFSAGNISNNVISYSGATAPEFIIGSFNGAVLNNTISMQPLFSGSIIALVPDVSPVTAVSTFSVQGNSTSARIIQANVAIPSGGFTDTGQVCVQNNTVRILAGQALAASSSIVNQHCP